MGKRLFKRLLAALLAAVFLVVMTLNLASPFFALVVFGGMLAVTATSIQARAGSRCGGDLHGNVFTSNNLAVVLGTAGRALVYPTEEDRSYRFGTIRNIARSCLGAARPQAAISGHKPTSLTAYNARDQDDSVLDLNNCNANAVMSDRRSAVACAA